MSIIIIIIIVIIISIDIIIIIILLMLFLIKLVDVIFDIVWLVFGLSTIVPTSEFI